MLDSHNGNIRSAIVSAKRIIPNLDSILDETWKYLNINKRDACNNFGDILILIDEKAKKIFRKYERNALTELAKIWLEQQRPNIKIKLKNIVREKGWGPFIRKACRLFLDFGILVQKLEKDLGNMRKARGGKTFEKAILRLLEFINIKGEIPKGGLKKNLKRIDIVIPSAEVAFNTPDRAIFLTCKRTLRERWKQEVPQVRPNQRVYLITIDNSLSQEKANEINAKGLIVFIKDDLKEEPELKKLTWVRKLKDLPKELRRL